MKNLFIVFLTILCLFSCKKDPIEEIPQVVCVADFCIDGEWIWVSSSGSFAGVIITPETENESRRLIITSTTYQEYHGNDLVIDTDYEFVESDELLGFTNENLVLKLGTGNWLAVIDQGETLLLREPCFDCWDHVYELE